MAWIIHYRDTASGREMQCREIEQRDAALSQACSLLRKQMCEVHKIVGPSGQEIGRSEIDRYCKSSWQP